MSDSRFNSGLLRFLSGFDAQVTSDNSFTENRDIARSRVSSQLAHSFSREETKIIRSLPGTGKTYSTMQQATNQRRTVVLALQTYELIDEKAQDAREKHDADVLTINSAYQKCPSYTGEHGQDLAEGLRSGSLTPGRLHELSHSEQHDIRLPCTEHNCPYMEQFDRDFDSYDLVVTTHGMLHAESLTEDRDVVIDEFSRDVYVTEIENPRGVVNHYLDFINSPIGSWGQARKTEDMATLSAHNLQTLSYESDWEQECIRAGDTKQPAHKDANLLVEALAYGTRKGQTTHYRRDSLTEVLITSDSAKILQRPNFEETHSVVGLDATASEMMWQKFCHSNFEVVSVLSDGEKATLWEQSGGELAVMGNYAQHASGGNISVVPTKHAQDAIRLTHGKTYTFSTKRVKENTPIEVDGYYGRDETGTNEFGDADTLLLAGAPHPGDHVIRETAAWFGENVAAPRRDDPRDMGVNLSYGSEVADEIFAQFRESRVEQAIFRGNRLDGSGLTVLSTTSCLPEWIPVRDELPMPRGPGEKERAVLESLQALDTATTRAVQRHVDGECESVGSVSERHVRRVLTKYARLGVVAVGTRPTDERATLWSFSSLSLTEIPDNLSDIVCSEFNNNPCPIDAERIRKAVARLMKLGWAELDWAEWIARQELNRENSVISVG